MPANRSASGEGTDFGRGFGTRISEETHLKPKPTLEVGGQPLIWHILKTYSLHGINDLLICLGYRGYVVKEYYANCLLDRSDVSIDLGNESMEVHARHAEPWRGRINKCGRAHSTYR